MENKRGFAGLLYLVISIVVGMILIMSVLIPVTNSSITTANFTTGSTNANVANTIPTILLVGGLVLAASLSLYGFASSRK